MKESKENQIIGDVIASTITGANNKSTTGASGREYKPHRYDRLCLWMSTSALVCSIASIIALVALRELKLPYAGLIVSALTVITGILIAKQVFDSVTMEKKLEDLKKIIEQQSERINDLTISTSSYMQFARIYEAIISVRNDMSIYEKKHYDVALNRAAGILSQLQLHGGAKEASQIAYNILAQLNNYFDDCECPPQCQGNLYLLKNRKAVKSLYAFLPRNKQALFSYLINSASPSPKSAPYIASSE